LAILLPLTNKETKLARSWFKPLAVLPKFVINHNLYVISKTETITSTELAADETTDK
jgi:hypothetical protein